MLTPHTVTVSKNWLTITDSQYAWERDALEFVRSRFPTHEPYRAWTNFEFIADDGSINEVDLLVCTPQGFFLVEIKSRPGRLFGDAGTWTWETDKKLITIDNPRDHGEYKGEEAPIAAPATKGVQEEGAASVP